MSAPAPEDQQQSTQRRDALIEAEGPIKAAWTAAKLFEADAPKDAAERAAKNKFMVTFPFPYMNGALHVGHAFSMMKAEFAVRFHRLLGKKVLFPFGFHCTGMPILACAQKLQKEIATYGCPPVFPVEKAAEEEEPEPEAATAAAEEAAAAAPEAAADAAADAAPKEKTRKKKGKLALKSSGAKFQWQIMQEMGVPDEDIPKFQDPQFWLGYFPPIARRDLDAVGCAIDWRRSFITTDANPYFDAFVRWQFNKLKAKNKVSYGTLMSIVSPANKQVCADHDRATGEGVTAQAYTLIKLRLARPYPAAVRALLPGACDDLDIVLPAATLRPETMYGQTNAFVLPTGDYAVYRVSEREVYVCTDRSALNLAFQGGFADTIQEEQQQGLAPLAWGECARRRLGEVRGQALLGCAVHAPLAQYERVYLLPLLSILMDKGTGIVTSVPSDAPHDYAALMDLRNKKEFRAKFGIADECVLPFEVKPVITVAELGTDRVAELLCKQAGVKSQNDAVLLNKCKADAYLMGFEKGVMCVGPHAGRPVKEAKDIIREELVAAGLAQHYSEPESLVVARTGEVCVAGAVNQWFLTYGEPAWRDEVKAHVADANAFSANAVVRHRLHVTINWLRQWGCSRAFGLGTKLPFDENGSVIESLSDSTIYMAYYTIAVLLQGGKLDGSATGVVRPDQLCDALFDYVFLETPYDAEAVHGVPQSVLDTMRAEFAFWYPFDLRVSGKDLLNNHLVMSLYNHAAIWGGKKNEGEDGTAAAANPYMPKSFYANGMLMIDNAKMSKSTGNFLTLADAVARFGADACRFAMASSGDSIEDANFSSKVANNAILRLHKELAFCDEMIAAVNASNGASTDANVTVLRPADSPLGFFDRVQLSQVSQSLAQARAAYSSVRMMDAVKHGGHDLCNLRDAYKLACAEAGTPMHAGVVRSWLHAYTVAMSPICPFWAQTMWSKLTAAGLVASREPFVFNAQWPAEDEVDHVALRQAHYLNAVVSNVRAAATRTLEVLAKKAKKDAAAGAAPAPVALKSLTIRVATAYPAWQVQVLAAIAAIEAEQVAAAAAGAAGAGAEGAEGAAVEAPLSNAAPVNAAVKALFAQHPNKKMLTTAMAFAAAVRADYAARGRDALDLAMPFDEAATLKEHLAYVLRGVEGVTADNTTIELVTPDANADTAAATATAQGPTPGKAFYSFGV